MCLIYYRNMWYDKIFNLNIITYIYNNNNNNNNNNSYFWEDF